ncbi:MAG: thiamine ABC transporter substrate-binding protein [Bifidobacteriaceae bacterium]|nr:thiamine ABC transporter substrate-binding protein [Bifidobacteriaceae bacterium]
MKKLCYRALAVCSVFALILSVSACQNADNSIANDQVTLLAYDSFQISDETIAQIKSETGYALNVITAGNAGELASRVILSAGEPEGDLVYGIDSLNTEKITAASALADYNIGALPKLKSAVDAGFSKQLMPVDYGFVCVNADKQYFADSELALPDSLDKLAEPEYAARFVAINPTTSSPGRAFFIKTVDKYGENGWKDYWLKLKAGGVRIASSWSDAYEVDYSVTAGGAYPLMVSYSTSPADTVDDATNQSKAVAIPETCTAQTEYAGVLKGAKNETGANKVLEFLLQTDFQNSIGSEMYMYPVNADANVPADWEKFAPEPDSEYTKTNLSTKTVSDNYDKWLEEWNELQIG